MKSAQVLVFSGGKTRGWAYRLVGKDAVKPMSDRRVSASAAVSDIDAMTPEERRRLLVRLLAEKRMREAAGFPMSEGQQSLWSAYRRNPGISAFNVFLPVRYRTAIDVEALRRAVESVCQRHEMLRTTFGEFDGRLLQYVHAGLQPRFEIHAAENLSDECLRATILREVQQPFDLGRGPLLRLDLYRRAPDDWIVLAAAHHIVIDHWSLVLVLQEVQTTYQALREHNASPSLAVPSNNYRQYVLQQQRLLEGEEGKRLQRFWATMLEGAEPVVDIPTDFFRPGEFTHRAATCALEIPSALFARVKRLAAELHATPFAVMHSSVQVFLHRYSGANVFLVGSPAAGRQNHAFANTVGFFVNMLPLRADLTGNPAFATLVQRTAQMIASGLEHEAYPINRIVADSGVGRDPSRSPLFQFCVTYEKSHVREQAGRISSLFPRQQHLRRISGILQQAFYVPVPTCHYDMEFVFEQTPDALNGMICYCRDLFDAASMECMARNFVQLLDSLVHWPALPVATAPWQRQAVDRPSTQRPPSTATARPVGTASDRASSGATVSGGHDPGHSHPSSADRPDGSADRASQWERVDAGIASVAGRQAGAPALRWRSERLTYGELDARARGLACSMLEADVDPGSLVPVIGMCRPATLVAIAAVQMAGCVPIPLDVRWARETLEKVRRQVQPGMILLDDCADMSFDAPGIVVRYGESLPPPASGGSLARVRPRPSDWAYVIFTSGSTGGPKGVAVRHDAVCNTLRWHARAVPIGPGDRMLMLLSHQFDAGLGNAWCCLLAGAELVWADDPDQVDPNALIQQIQRDRITVVPAIPSHLEALVDHPRFSQCACLRMLWTGGESMPADLPSKIARRTSAALWNFYGPTEAAIEAAAIEVSRHDARRRVPIGHAIDGAIVRVVDSMRREVPDTVPGELAIGGRGVADGYFGDPQLTEQRFVTLELEGRPSRFYLTGDLCRRNGQGQLEFLGRKDHQIKWRGCRIELTEIESVLGAHAWVDRAALKPVGRDSTTHLWAFVTLVAPPASLLADSDPAGGGPLSPAAGTQHVGGSSLEDQRAMIGAALMRYLRSQLPAYKVPSAVAVVDSLPLTASGKVDRKRLPDRIDVPAGGVAQSMPRTVIEQFLLERWREVVGDHCRSVQQNFFDLGGTSLQAAMLASRLTHELGIDVPTSLLLDAMDIAEVATQLATLYPRALVERFGAAAVDLQRRLGAAGDRLHELVVALKPSGSRAPLYMVHPPGGIVVCYRELARSVVADQPLYAIRSRGLHGSEPLPDSLEAMAAEYVEAIRSHQPQGPYRLGGWSLGGLVAYEMARQIAADGETVTQLVLLDTSIPDGATDLVPAEEKANVGMEYGIALSLDQLAELTPEQQLPMLWDHARKLGVLTEEAPPEVVNKTLHELRGLFHHHLALSRAYRLSPAAIPIDLFRPSETPVPLQVSEDRGWRCISPNVRVHFVPGHHHSMVQSPNVQFIARQL